MGFSTGQRLETLIGGIRTLDTVVDLVSDRGSNPHASTFTPSNTIQGSQPPAKGEAKMTGPAVNLFPDDEKDVDASWILRRSPAQ